MMQVPSAPPDPEASRRLDSWKQIAAYLDKSERTVRRWQQTEGLPVHKHQHQAKGSVWAYTNEVDDWLNARRVSPEPPLADDPATMGVETPDRPRNRMALRVAVTGAIAAAAIAGWLYVRPAPVAAPVYTTTTPFTSLQGVEYGPAFSPDGRQVAFFWGTPDRQSIGIYVKGRDSEQPAPVDTGNGFAYSPAWSPDGKTIAFLRRTKDGTWLCLVGATGGPARNLARLSDRQAFFASSRHLSWSLDGRTLLAPMQKPNRQDGIFRISLDGNEQRLTDAHPAHSPMLAPDGKSFAYVRDGGSPHGSYEIIWQTEDGARTVFRGQGMPAGLDWAPGGKHLVACLPVIETAHGSGNRLYRLTLDGKTAPQLLGPSRQCSTVTVSRTEPSTLVFGAVEDRKVRIWRAPGDGLDQRVEFAPSSRSDEYPAFSPDGQSIAFVSTRSGKHDVWVARADGSSARQITENVVAEGTPRWSPDGSRLLFGAAALQPKGLMTAPIAGGSPQPIPLGGQMAEAPVWSQDGRHIYYSSGSELWRCRADGGDRTRLRSDGWQIPVGESPDGRYLYVVKLAKVAELAELTLAGGPDRILGPLSNRLVDRDVAITPRGLYFPRPDGGLYRLPFGGEPILFRPSFLDSKAEVHRGLTVSPDEKWILWGDAIPGRGRAELDLEQIPNFK